MAEKKCNRFGAKGLYKPRDKASCDKLKEAGCSWMTLPDGSFSGCVLDHDVPEGASKGSHPLLDKMESYLNKNKEERSELKKGALKKKEGKKRSSMKPRSRSRGRSRGRARGRADKRSPMKPKRRSRSRSKPRRSRATKRRVH
tara:strand:+ start:100 stop:528 length:429 start_codon:yes stop_codon:yes gene_type:complete